MCTLASLVRLLARSRIRAAGSETEHLLLDLGLRGVQPVAEAYEGGGGRRLRVEVLQSHVISPVRWVGGPRGPFWLAPLYLRRKRIRYA